MLQPPKKMAAGGYHLAHAPIVSPKLQYTNSTWIPTKEWEAWAAKHRQELIGELLSHGNWFSRPPRRDTIESLFGPWVGKTMQGDLKLFCKQPETPNSNGTGEWVFEGLTMNATAITPVWSLQGFVEDPDQDTISLFGDGDTVDEEEREIQIEEIEIASPAAAPTKMRNREWEAAKFLAKERVREARLKAQIADRVAAKEESRFYAKYGELEDNESQFSEYDLSENEEGGSDSDSP